MFYKNFFRELFHTVIDMLATLIHSTLITDSQPDRSDENKKHYMNLMKKLKKVLNVIFNSKILLSLLDYFFF